MASQDVIDEILNRKQIRLTPRAKQLLALILDGLLNEPFHRNPKLLHPMPPEEVFHNRVSIFDAEVRRLPDIFEEIANKNQANEKDSEGYSFITLFDLLHNFESSIGRSATMFFPGKI